MSLGKPDSSNNPEGEQKEQNEWDCPFCGEGQENLPAHMRACDGDTDE